MCTSCAAKPARSRIAAVSVWLLTPCSRSTATAGRAPRAMYGAAMSSSGSNRSATESPGSSTALSLVLLVRALRIIAQPPQAPGSLGPGAAQFLPRLIERNEFADVDTYPQIGGRFPDPLHDDAGQLVPGENLLEARLVVDVHLQHDPQLFREELLEGACVRVLRQSHIEPAVSGERHLHQGGEQAPVRPVVIGPDQSCRTQLGE